MPNWCFTEYRVIGEKEELDALEKIMNGLAAMPKPKVENDFGPTWLGCLVDALGGNWKAIRCRGDWSDLQRFDENELSFNTETAWDEMSEVRHFIEEKFPSVSIYYIAEEEGNGIYRTNDAEHRFWENCYTVYVEDEGREEFTEMPKAIEYVEKVIGRKISEGEDPADALAEWAEEREIEAWVDIKDYDIVDD